MALEIVIMALPPFHHLTSKELRQLVKDIHCELDRRKHAREILQQIANEHGWKVRYFKSPKYNIYYCKISYSKMDTVERASKRGYRQAAWKMVRHLEKALCRRKDYVKELYEMCSNGKLYLEFVIQAYPGVLSNPSTICTCRVGDFCFQAYPVRHKVSVTANSQEDALQLAAKSVLKLYHRDIFNGDGDVYQSEVINPLLLTGTQYLTPEMASI